MAIGARIFGGLFNGVLGAWKCIIGESGDSLVQVGSLVTGPVQPCWACV